MHDFDTPALKSGGDTPPALEVLDLAQVAEWIGYGRLAVAVGRTVEADAILARAQRALLGRG